MLLIMYYLLSYFYLKSLILYGSKCCFKNAYLIIFVLGNGSPVVANVVLVAVGVLVVIGFLIP